MSSEHAPSSSSTEAYEQTKQCSAKEALKHDLRSIDVPEDTTVLLSPTSRDFADCFLRVHLRSYEDLQTLGFVPRGLSEENVRKAIAGDDDETYKMAQTTFCQVRHDCDCSEHRGHTANPHRNKTLRSTYTAIRKSHNPNLARLLSDHYGTRMPWDSPIAGIVAKWTGYIEIVLDPLILVLFAQDITINRNATLAVDANAKSLMARDIKIHNTGKLVHQGGYLKVWANSISRLDNLFVGSHVVPWLVQK